MLTFLKFSGRAGCLQTASKWCTLRIRTWNPRLRIGERGTDLSLDEVHDACVVNDSLTCLGLSFNICGLEITLPLVIRIKWGIARWMLLVMRSSHYQRRHNCWQKGHHENPAHLRPKPWGFLCIEPLSPQGQLMAHSQNLLVSLALKMDCTNHKKYSNHLLLGTGYILYRFAQWGIALSESIYFSIL